MARWSKRWTVTGRIMGAGRNTYPTLDVDGSPLNNHQRVDVVPRLEAEQKIDQARNQERQRIQEALDKAPYRRSGTPANDYQTGYDAGVEDVRKLLAALDTLDPSGEKAGDCKRCEGSRWVCPECGKGKPACEASDCSAVINSADGCRDCSEPNVLSRAEAELAIRGLPYILGEDGEAARVLARRLIAFVDSDSNGTGKKPASHPSGEREQGDDWKPVELHRGGPNAEPFRLLESYPTSEDGIETRLYVPAPAPDSQLTLREALERAWLLGWHYRDDMGERTSVDEYTKVAEAHAYAALCELRGDPSGEQGEEERWPEFIVVALGPDDSLNTAHTPDGIKSLSRRQSVRTYTLAPICQPANPATDTSKEER
jgi:hypothetical protein